MIRTPTPAPDFPPMFAKMPAMQAVFLVLLAATWLIGGNVVFALHFRRLGQSPWTGLKTFANPVLKFNARGWLSLLGVAALAMFFGTMALVTGMK